MEEASSQTTLWINGKRAAQGESCGLQTLTDVRKRPLTTPISLWTRWTRVNKTFTVYDTRLKVSGLLEGSEYQFRVTAVNAAGQSPPSDATPYILCKDPTCKGFNHLLTFLVALLYFSTVDFQNKQMRRCACVSCQIPQLPPQCLASQTQPSTASA